MKAFTFDTAFKILDAQFVKLLQNEEALIDKISKKIETLPKEKGLDEIIDILKTSLGIDEESLDSVFKSTPFIQYVPSIYEKVGIYHFRKPTGDILFDKKSKLTILPKFTMDFFNADFFIVGNKKEIFNLIKKRFKIRANKYFFFSSERLKDARPSKTGILLTFESPLISTKKEKVNIHYENRKLMKEIVSKFEPGDIIYESITRYMNYLDEFRITSLSAYSVEPSYSIEKVKIDYDHLTDQDFSLLMSVPSPFLRKKMREFFKRKTVLDLFENDEDSTLLMDIKYLFDNSISFKTDGEICSFRTRRSNVNFKITGITDNKEKIRKIVGNDKLNEILLIIEMK